MFFVYKSGFLAKANVCWDRERNSRPNSDTERWDGLENANWLGIKKLPQPIWADLYWRGAQALGKACIYLLLRAVDF